MILISKQYLNSIKSFIFLETRFSKMKKREKDTFCRSREKTGTALLWVAFIFEGSTDSKKVLLRLLLVPGFVTFCTITRRKISERWIFITISNVHTFRLKRNKVVVSCCLFAKNARILNLSQNSLFFVNLFQHSSCFYTTL